MARNLNSREAVVAMARDLSTRGAAEAMARGLSIRAMGYLSTHGAAEAMAHGVNSRWRAAMARGLNIRLAIRRCIVMTPSVAAARKEEMECWTRCTAALEAPGRPREPG